MFESSVFWLRVAVVLYALGLGHTTVTVLRRTPLPFAPAFWAFAVGTVLHMVSVVEMWFALGHLPADNFLQSSSLCGFLLALTFLFTYWRYRFDSLGVFLFPLVFLMSLVGAMELPVASWSNQSVRGAWLLVHVLLVLLGYAALVVMAMGSVFYLIQEQHLKSKKPPVLFARLPPLGTLDNLINRSMGLGFVLLTLATIAGSMWAFIESGTRWIGEAKVAISLLTWALVLLMVFLRTAAGWRGRKAALLSLAVIGCSAITWAAHVGLRPLLAR
ncbi:MAG: hypothetical protein FJW39_16645 [Acidobacteria bacterium]|nr:hypothetical protein [Acidobacteriota bacterium]